MLWLIYLSKLLSLKTHSEHSSLMHRLNHYLTPITLGLVIALWVLQLFPEWSPTTNSEAHNKSALVHSYSESVRKAVPAVVNIYTTKILRRNYHPLLDDPFFSRFFNLKPTPREKAETSLGSGVILHQDGFVITNNHVIEGADEILIALQDGRSTSASIVGTDPDTDLALLKINLPDIPSIQIGQDELLSVGDVVLAIGNPFGFGQTVTLGIVSATGRNQVGITDYENFIQTDAAINPGNSGGALINTKGELIGINTAIISKSGGSMGIGFAIPVRNALSVMEQLAKHGRVIRGWLGVYSQPLTPTIRKNLELPDSVEGLIITDLDPKSPGRAAGLQRGDIITYIDDIRSADGQKVKKYIARLQPGEQIRINFIRQGQGYQTTAQLTEKE